jgi:FlaA1/EpsC-like NDP-sugar epimerase
MQAGAIGRGGEIFVLDMGEPLRIVDLALDMIRRRGLTVGEDIELRFTGVRPGEKLYEQLAADDDAIRPTAHEKIRVWELPRPSPHQLCRALEQLAFAAADGRREVVVAALRQAVPEYAPPDVTQAADADRAALTERVPALRLVPPESAAA